MASNILAFLLVCLYHIAGSAASHDSESHNVTEVIIDVADTNNHELSSPDFPKCCEPVKYLLRKKTKDGDINWKLIFTDLDLPLASELLIYGIDNHSKTKLPIDSARYYNRAWIRPVVLYSGDALSIEFLPSIKFHIPLANNTKSYGKMSPFVGFKAFYWLDKDTWKLDKPYTFCPQVGDSFEGGKVKVNDLGKLLERQHYRMHCIWQLKPVPQSDLEVYIKLEKLTGSDSMIKIREGLTSDDTLELSKSVLNNPERISSKIGFYIELSKSSEGSQFEMSYGVQKPLKRGEDCTFLVDSYLVRGFRCEEEDSKDLCIPNGSVCNSINNCKNGFDERREICEERSTTTATTVSVTTILPSGKKEACMLERCKDGRCRQITRDRCPEDECPNFSRRCPGTLKCVLKGIESCPTQKCTHFEKQCPDGSCALEHKLCKDNSHRCTYNEKRCKNGRCYKKYERCPEDPCESSKPFKCHVLCLYPSQVCDGYTHCPGNQDEANCPEEEVIIDDNGIPAWGQFMIYCSGIAPFLIICCCIGKICKNGDKEGRTENDDDNDTEQNPENPNLLPVNMSACNPAAIPLQPNEGTALMNPSVNCPTPSAPPAYGDIMNDPSPFQPPEPPPAYSAINDSQVAADCEEAGPIFKGAANSDASLVV